MVGALAAARTSGPGLKVLADLDHFLHPAGTSPDERFLAPAALRALHEFTRPWHRE